MKNSAATPKKKGASIKCVNSRYHVEIEARRDHKNW